MSVWELRNPKTGKIERITAIEGASAYRVAVLNGFQGTEQEWLDSLQGADAPQINDNVTNLTNPWSSQKIANEVDKTKNLVVTTTQSPLGGFICDYSSSEIRNALISNRLVEMHFEDTIENSGNQVYPFLKFKDNVAYFRRVQVLSSYTRQIDIMVNYDKSVTFEEHKFYGTGIYFATCYDEAEPLKEAPNKWYVPKTMPKPSAEVGTMVAVQWVNGRVDGIGYDIQLIWGEPDGVDNEVIVDKANTSGGKNGVNIPTGGTITYQLVESNGRRRWKYVDGELISQSYSSDTLADVPNKVVPNLDTNYLSGMEIYLQLDNGNTAEVMNIVPTEGATLPVYGNGLGTKTGNIEKGYILHLKNAGNYWQILNGGSSGGSGDNAIQFVDVIDTATAVEGVTYFAPNVFKLPEIVPILNENPKFNNGYIWCFDNDYYLLTFDIDSLFVSYGYPHDRMYHAYKKVGNKWVEVIGAHDDYKYWSLYINSVSNGHPVPESGYYSEEKKKWFQTYMVWMTPEELIFDWYTGEHKPVFTKSDNKFNYDGTPITPLPFQFEYKTYDATAKKELPNSNFKGLIDKLPKPSGEVWENIDLTTITPAGMFTSTYDEKSDTIINTLNKEASAFDFIFNKNYKKLKITVLSRVTVPASFSVQTFVSLKPVNAETSEGAETILQIGDPVTIYNSSKRKIIYEIEKVEDATATSLFKVKSLSSDTPNLYEGGIDTIVTDFDKTLYSESRKDNSFKLNEICFSSMESTNNILKIGSTFSIKGVVE